MRQHVLFKIKFSDDWHPSLDWYIHGDDILTMASSASTVALQGATVPAAAGDASHPWVLNNYAAWVGAAKELLATPEHKNSEIYFRAGGRLICKNAKPNGDGYYVSDNALSGTDSTAGNIWSREHGASYREFGRMFSDREGPLTEAAWSRATAAKLRDVIKGDADYSTSGRATVEAPLPMLACAMFLSEVARNHREFMIGLMMLDLIGDSYGRAGTKLYTLEKIFSHPDRIARTGVAISKPQRGPTTNRYSMVGPKGNKQRVDAPQTVAQLGKAGDLAFVEGKYPASPGRSAATSDTIAVADDYIQQKEASIAAGWLVKKYRGFLGADDTVVQVSGLRHDADMTGLKRIGPGQAVVAPAPATISQKFLQSCADEFLTVSKRFMSERASSFD